MQKEYYTIDTSFHPEFAFPYTYQDCGAWGEAGSEYAVITNFTKDNSWEIVGVHKNDVEALQHLGRYIRSVDSKVKGYWRTAELPASQVWLNSFRNFKVKLVRVTSEPKLQFLS
jgi:hypothetical protein